MNNFLKLVRQVFVLSSIIFASAAFADADCSTIMKDGRVDPSFHPRTICNDDLIASSINMLLADTYNKSGSMKSAYNASGLPTPDVTGGSYDSISGMVTAISVAVMQIFYFLGLLVLSVGLIFKVSAIIKSEQPLSQAVKDPELIKSSAFVTGFLLLAVPVDGVMVYHTIVVLVVGFGLSLTSQMVTFLLPAFMPVVGVSENDYYIEPYLAEGESYAVEFVRATTAMRDSLAFMAPATISNPDKQQLLLADSHSDTPYWQPSGGRSLYTKENLSAQDYAKHILNVKSVSFVSNPLISQVSASAVISDVLVNEYRLSDGIASGDERLKEVVSNTTNPQDLFTTRVVAKQVVTLPPITRGLADELLAVAGSTAIYDATFNRPTLSSDELKDLSEPYRIFFEGLTEQHERALATQLLPAALLGYIKEPRLQTSSTLNFFNPRERNANGLPDATRIFNGKLSTAIQASEDFVSASCAHALLTNETAASKVLSDALFAKELQDETRSFRALPESAKIANLQCFSLDGDKPVFLLADLFDNSIPAEALDPTLDLEERFLNVLSQESEIQNYILSKTADGKSKIDAIARYYATVKAIVGVMAVEYALSDEVATGDQVTSDVRRKGAGGLHAYFFQLANLMKEVREAYLSAVAISVAHSVDLDETFYVPELQEEETGFSLFSWFSSDDLSRIMDQAKQSFLPTTPMLERSVVGSDTSLAIYAGDMEEASLSSGIATTIESFIEWAIVPTDVLRDGFGFDQDLSMAENFKGCASITNCVDIKGHPLLTMSEFGKDMFYSSVKVIIIDFVLQDVILMSVYQGLDKFEKYISAAIGSSGGKLFGVLKLFGGAGVVLLQVLVSVVAVISGVFATFAKAFVLVGLLLGFILPILPLLTGIFMWMGYVFEVFIMYTLGPVLLFLVLFRYNGKPILEEKDFVSMFLSLIIKPSLYVVSFVGLFAMSFIAFYLINSTAYFLYDRITLEGANFFFTFISSQLSLAIIVFIYYKLLVKINNMMAQLPEHIMQGIGVRSFNTVAATGVEQLIAARAISNVLTSATPPANFKLEKERYDKAKKG